MFFLKKKNKITNKTIWTLWYQGYEQAPELVKQCIVSWQKFNPGYSIKFLDKNNLFDYVEFPKELDLNREDIPVQKISALSRLALLRKYGGVWTDATVFCCKSLDSWLPEYYTTGFFAFRNPKPDKMFCNWFIVSEPNNIITKCLYNNLLDFFKDNIFQNQNTDFGNQVIQALSPLLNQNYKSTLQWHSDIIVKGLKVYPYFIMNYIFIKLMLENSKCRKTWNSSKEFKDERTRKLIRLYDPNNEDSIRQAIEEIKSQKAPVFKLSWKGVDTNNNYWSEIIKYLNLQYKNNA